MESIIAGDIKSLLFSNSLISAHQFRFRLGHSTLDMLFLLCQRWWRPSTSDKRSRLSLWTYSISSFRCSLSSIQTVCLWNSRPTPLWDCWLPPPSQIMCGSQRNPFISSPCRGWSTPRQCSRPHPIPDPYQWLLWLENPLDLCWRLHSLLWYSSSFRQAVCSLFAFFRT